MARLNDDPRLDETPMSDLLFSSSGDVIQGGASGLRAYLGRYSAQGDIVAFAIRNLGFAQVERKRELRIRLRPSIVHDIALAQALTFLADTGGDRCMISWLESEWHDELFGRKEAAISRLVGLVEEHRSDIRQRLHHRDLGIDGIDMIPLVRLIERWSELGGVYDRERLARTCEQTLAGRYLIAAQRPGSRSLTIEEIGPGLILYNRDWPMRLEGQRVEDMLDHGYGRWVAQSLRHAQARGTPTHSEVDALLQTGGGRYKRARYRRVIVPFTDRSGQSFVLSASLFDDRVDLAGKLNQVG